MVCLSWVKNGCALLSVKGETREKSRRSGGACFMGINPNRVLLAMRYSLNVSWFLHCLVRERGDCGNRFACLDKWDTLMCQEFCWARQNFQKWLSLLLLQALTFLTNESHNPRIIISSEGSIAIVPAEYNAIKFDLTYQSAFKHSDTCLSSLNFS